MARYARPSRRAGSFARAPRSAPMDPVRLALDVGPLYGHRTGVGVAVAELAARARPPRRRRRPSRTCSASGPARSRRCASSRCRRPSPSGCGRSATARASTAGWAAPTSSTARTTSCRRRGEPAVVSVYDCWFLRNPAEASRRRPPGRRGAAPPGPRRRRRPRVQPRHGRRRPRPPRRRRRRGRPPRPARRAGARRRRRRRAGSTASPAGRSCSRSAPSSGARTSRPWSPRSPPPGSTPDTALVIAGAPGDDSDALDAAVEALAPAARRQVLRPGPVDAATKSWLLHHAARARLPVARRGVRVPPPRGPGRRAARSSPRAPARSPRSPARGAELVPVGDRDALGAALAAVARPTTDAAPTLVAAGRANVTRFSWSATADAMVDLYRRVRRDASNGAPR